MGEEAAVVERRRERMDAVDARILSAGEDVNSVDRFCRI